MELTQEIVVISTGLEVKLFIRQLMEIYTTVERGVSDVLVFSKVIRLFSIFFIFFNLLLDLFFHLFLALLCDVVDLLDVRERVGM